MTCDRCQCYHERAKQYCLRCESITEIETRILMAMPCPRKRLEFADFCLRNNLLHPNRMRALAETRGHHMLMRIAAISRMWLLAGSYENEVATMTETIQSIRDRASSEVHDLDSLDDARSKGPEFYQHFLQQRAELSARLLREALKGE